MCEHKRKQRSSGPAVSWPQITNDTVCLSALISVIESFTAHCKTQHSTKPHFSLFRMGTHELS